MKTIKASEIKVGQLVTLTHVNTTIFILVPHWPEHKINEDGIDTVLFGGRNIHTGQIERFKLYADSPVFLRELN